MSALEQMELSGDVTVSRQVPVLVGEENVTHPRKLHARLEVVALFWPAFAELHASARNGLCPVGVDLDPVEINVWTVQHETRAHVGPHGLVVLNLHRAAVQ